MAEGKGIEKDEVKAAALLHEACDARVWHACTNLAVMYSGGRGGLPKDDIRAAALLKLACDGRDPFGCEKLALRYKEGQGIDKDLEKATSLFKQACGYGVNEGCIYYQALRK